MTDVTRSTVSLIWSAPVYDGGSKVVGYIIERKPVSEVGDGRWLKCNYTIVSDNFFTVTALSEGDTYEFRVLAKNAAGVISKGSESTGPVTCRDEYGKKIIIIIHVLLLNYHYFCDDRLSHIHSHLVYDSSTQSRTGCQITGGSGYHQSGLGSCS